MCNQSRALVVLVGEPEESAKDPNFKFFSCMKRYGHTQKAICTMRNMRIADEHAREHTRSRKEVTEHDKSGDLHLDALKINLASCGFRTSEYKLFTIHEPKERVIYKLPYYPDRIAQHAIMNVLKPIWIKTMIHQTYSSIEGRGIEMLRKELQRDLKKWPHLTTYCLKLDIHKFYPSINHDILKEIIRKKLKDPRTLRTLDGIIDSTNNFEYGVGVPIGNYLSQYFANLYLSEFDHTMKEQWGCQFYYRYADDIVILSNDKKWLHNLLLAIKMFMHQKLKLELKPNYQVFPVESRGIDFVGYVFRHNYIKLRKSIKKQIVKLCRKKKQGKICKTKFKRVMASYNGWLMHCDSLNLIRSLNKKYCLNMFVWNKTKKTKMTRWLGIAILVYRIIQHKRYFEICFKYNGQKYVMRSNFKKFKAYAKTETYPFFVTFRKQ